MNVSDDKLKRLQTYELMLRELNESDIDMLHQLSVGVGWPHRPDDLRLLLELGKGFAGCDKIGRMVASAMWFPIGDNLATIGMVITSPRLQALGAGRWMMNHVVKHCGGRDLQLNAPRVAYRLYDALGFKPVGVVHQHQGEAVDPGTLPVPSGAAIRPLEATDLGDIIALDKAAFGADRTAILTALLPYSSGTVLVRDGRTAGFALCRKFGRGHVVGPIVAGDSGDAIALTAPHVANHVGNFLRVDTPHGDGEFKDFIHQCGMPACDTVTTMSRPPRPQVDTGTYTFALASHTLG